MRGCGGGTAAKLEWSSCFCCWLLRPQAAKLVVFRGEASNIDVLGKRRQMQQDKLFECVILAEEKKAYVDNWVKVVWIFGFYSQMARYS